MHPDERHLAAWDSLQGLALGDAFGQTWYFHGQDEAVALIKARRTPDDGRWRWTDDTALALAVMKVLSERGRIEQTALARTFAATYAADPSRGYGHGMHQLLPALARDPGEWETRARTLFGGEGSMGNGAATRVAPLGAWFEHDDLGRVALEATASAVVTHAHPEGIAGAVAVATATAFAARREQSPPPHAELLANVAALTPKGAVHDGLLTAAELPEDTPPRRAAAILGSGGLILATDTVPFALWSAARNLDDLPAALWSTAEGLGDVDTTCAIAGGVVAARTALAQIPRSWRRLREPLPWWAERGGTKE